MTSHDGDIRCFCSRKPLMAVYGVDKNGEPFIHVKVYKQSRIYAELYIDGDATCRIRCRECLRMHKVKIITTRRRLEVQREVMDVPAPDSPGVDVAPASTRPVR